MNPVKGNKNRCKLVYLVFTSQIPATQSLFRDHSSHVIQRSVDKFSAYPRKIFHELFLEGLMKSEKQCAKCVEQ